MVVQWALFILATFSNALRLHTGRITPLQLALKLGEYPYEAGTALMSAIDTEQCFDSFAHLLSVDTFSFRKYYQDACGSVNVSARNFINTVWRQAQHRGLDVGKLVGIECLANIYKFGMHMEANSHFWSFQSDSLLTSDVRLDNFTLDQIYALVKQVAEPVDDINPLTSAYLCPEIESYSSVLMSETRILDGPFLDACPIVGPMLVRRIPTVSGIDLSRVDKLSNHEKLKLASHLSSKFGIFDVVGKYLQLGSLAVFASPHSPVYRNRPKLISPPVMKSLKSALADLNRVNKYTDKSRPGHNLILDIARELSSTMINTNSHAFDLLKLLKSLGTTDTFEFYTHIMNFLEGIFECEAQMNIQNMLKIVQVRVDALILLSQYSPAPDSLEQAIRELLADDRPSDMPFFRIPCRSLVTLLWSISRDLTFNYSRCCSLLMGHIVENMSHGSDLSILKWLQIYKYLPWCWKSYLMRHQAIISTSESDFHSPLGYAYLGKLVRLVSTVQQKDDVVVLGTDFGHENGYMNMEGHRRAIADLLLSILEHHFVYVGHEKNTKLPIYIQSLTCHPFIHDLFMRLIKNANILRIYLPFQLHPMMNTLMLNPLNSTMSSFYVSSAYFAELKSSKIETASKKHKMLLATSLIEHLNHLRQSKKKRRTLEAQYLSWAKQYQRQSKTAKTLEQLDEELRQQLTPEVMNNFTRQTFQDFDVNQIAGVTVSQAEGMTLLFNHAPSLT